MRSWSGLAVGLAGCASEPALPTVFVTEAQHAGDFGGIAGGDAICAASANRPEGDDRDYRALLVDGEERVACVSPDCVTGGAAENVDWPLVANTAYYRPDGLLLGTTLGNGLLPLVLETGIGDTNGEVWTGLTGWFDGTTGDTCAGWTSAGGLGGVGVADGASDGSWTFVYAQSCDREIALYCASIDAE